MRRRWPASVDPDDVDGLVVTVVSIDQRLSLFRRRLERFVGDLASSPDGAGSRPDVRARHSQQRDRAMSP
jgi:hypothetical protein